MSWNYRKAFDRLTEAYIQNKVNPYQSCACFVGNLLGGSWYWGLGRRIDISDHSCIRVVSKDHNEFTISSIEEHCEGFYLPEEVFLLEEVFLNSIQECVKRGDCSGYCGRWQDSPQAEDILFEVFSKTLDVLKSIHESKGEIIDPPVFKKRELAI